MSAARNVGLSLIFSRSYADIVRFNRSDKPSIFPNSELGRNLVVPWAKWNAKASKDSFSGYGNPFVDHEGQLLANLKAILASSLGERITAHGLGDCSTPWIIMRSRLATRSLSCWRLWRISASSWVCDAWNSTCWLWSLSLAMRLSTTPSAESHQWRLLATLGLLFGKSPWRANRLSHSWCV